MGVIFGGFGTHLIYPVLVLLELPNIQIAVSASVAVDRISIKSEKSSDCEEIFSLE